MRGQWSEKGINVADDKRPTPLGMCISEDKLGLQALQDGHKHWVQLHRMYPLEEFIVLRNAHDLLPAERETRRPTPIALSPSTPELPICRNSITSFSERGLHTFDIIQYEGSECDR